MVKNNNGFTLIELMITISLFGIVLLSMGSLLNYNISSFSKDSTYYKYKLDARYAMNKVINEIKKNYGTSFDLGKVKASDLTVLINSNKNDAVGNIYYFYDPDRYGIGDGYGELRGQSGETIVKNIKDFTIESINANLVKVTIKAGRDNSSRIFTIATYVSLYS